MSFLEGVFASSVRCDNCGRSFRQNLYDEPQKDGGMLRKFQCPRCGQEYPVILYTKRGWQLARQIQDAPATDRKTIHRLQRQLKKEVSRPWVE